MSTLPHNPSSPINSIMKTFSEDVWSQVVDVLAHELSESMDADYILAQRTVGAVAATSYTLRSLALPVLYRKVVLKSIARIEALRELTVNNPTLVSFTEQLFIRGRQSKGRPDSDCDVSDYLADPKHGRALLAQFLNLKSLGLSHFRLQASHIRACISHVQNINSFELSICTVSTLSLIWDILGTLPALRVCCLEFQLPRTIPPGDDLVLQRETMTKYPRLDHLLVLPIFPVGSTDQTISVCDAIVRAGCIDRLHTLDFAFTTVRIPALCHLLQHAAQSLKDLTIVCDHFSPQTAFLQFAILPRLRKLRLNWVNDHEDAANLLGALVRAAPNVSEVILWGVDLNSGALRTHAAPLWQIIEGETTLFRVEINVQQYVFWGEQLETEEDVRSMLPLTDGRGVLSVSLTHDD